MAKSRIAVDYDDVIVPYHDSFLEWYNEKNGTRHAFPEGEADYHLQESFGNDIQYWVDAMNEYHRSGLSSKLLPNDGVIDGLTRLAEANELVILTSRPSIYRPLLEAWVDEHAPGLFVEIHMYEGDPKKVTTSHAKGAVCVEIGARALIDDNPGYIRSADEHGVEGILFGDYSWNRGHHKLHTHAQDWAEVVLRLEG